MVRMPCRDTRDVGGCSRRRLVAGNRTDLNPSRHLLDIRRVGWPASRYGEEVTTSVMREAERRPQQRVTELRRTRLQVWLTGRKC